eukprot:GHRQ01016147.1.p1 GENE.GHRQ01016147.1~~GHRQ01016147.1.p1  ORF type:complete len:197 (+),score=54.56 GHRQ01016147.1:186-776(+)
MSRMRITSFLLRAAAKAARSSEQSGQYVARRMISTNGASLAAGTGRRMLGMSAWQIPIPLAAQGVRHISLDALKPSDNFVPRHNSTTPEEEAAMVKATGFSSLDALIDATVPKSIRRGDAMDMGRYSEGMTESEFLSFFKNMANKNQVFKSYIGMGYYDTHVPGVILRNVLENPGWYTQYTPYQAEIAQGRCVAVA